MWRKDDFSWIRGANYVPSYASNDVVIWRDFDPEVMDRELGYAEKLGLNSVRTFLQYIVYKDNPDKFRASFDKYLELCAEHGLKAMPVIFDSCFGQEPEIDWDGHWVMNPGYSREVSSCWPELEPYVDAVVGEHVGDERIVMWDVMNEPNGTQRTIDFVRHWLAVIRKMDTTHPTTIGVAGAAGWANLYADHADVLSFHSYSWPEQILRHHVHMMQKLGKEKGKPIVISETGHMAGNQPYEEAVRVLEEEKVGWYIWELMIAKTQFNKWQGVVYPDGTVRDPKAIAGISGRPLDKIDFEVRPDTEGVPYARGEAVAPSMTAEVREKIRDMAAKPATPADVEEQARFFVPHFLSVLHHGLPSEQEIMDGVAYWGLSQNKEAEPAALCAALNKLKTVVDKRIDEVDWDALK